MKKFFKAVGIGAAICTGIGVVAAVTKKIIDKNNSNEDVGPEFEDGESDETTDSTETN